MAGDETIRVTLEADSSQLTAEFRKARAEAVALGQRELPALTREILKAEQRNQVMTRGLREQTQASRQAGQGLLQLAFFADDLQYGMKGILNNIPGIIAALGAGAGLAGAISLAVLAGYKLLPLMKELFGEKDLSTIKAATEASAKRYAEELKALEKIKDEEAMKARVLSLVRDITIYAERELRVQDQLLNTFEDQAKNLQLQRKLMDELAKSRLALSMSQAGFPGSAAQAGLARGADEIGRQQRESRLQEDLKLAREESRRANDEYGRLEIASGNVKTVAEGRIAAARAEMAVLQRNMASSEANIEMMREKVAKVEKIKAENDLDEDEQAVYKRVRASQDTALANSTKRRDADAARMKELVLLEQTLTEERDKAAAQGQEQLSALSAQITAADARKKTLEAEKTTLEEINRLERERAQIEAVRERSAEMDEGFAQRQKQGEAERDAYYKEKDRLEKDAKRAGEVMGNRRDYEAETEILRRRAAGQKEQADALEREVALRREAHALAERLQVTEAQALRMVRDRARLREESERESRIGRAGENSRIRRSEGIQVGDRGSRLERSGGLEPSRGLRPAAERAASRDREIPDRSMEKAAANYYERSLANEEKLIGIFEKLGAIG